MRIRALPRAGNPWRGGARGRSSRRHVQGRSGLLSPHDELIGTRPTGGRPAAGMLRAHGPRLATAGCQCGGSRVTVNACRDAGRAGRVSVRCLGPAGKGCEAAPRHRPVRRPIAVRIASGDGSPGQRGPRSAGRSGLCAHPHRQGRRLELTRVTRRRRRRAAATRRTNRTSTTDDHQRWRVPTGRLPVGAEHRRGRGGSTESDRSVQLPRDGPRNRRRTAGHRRTDIRNRAQRIAPGQTDREPAEGPRVRP